MKVCSKCGVEKEYSEFNKRKEAKDGYRADCKECRKKVESLRQWKILDIKEKECKKCNLIKSVKEFAKAKQGYRGECKECVSKYNKKYDEENKILKKEIYKNWATKNKKHLKQYEENRKDSKKQYLKEYQEENREYIKQRTHIHYVNNKGYFLEKSRKRELKGKHNGGTYTTEQWKECLNYFNNECAYTGKPLDNEVLHVEHIQAISKGGTSYIWNLCPSIASANLSKSNKELEEWYKQQEYYTEERLNKIYEWQDYAYNKYKEFEEVV